MSDVERKGKYTFRLLFDGLPQFVESYAFQYDEAVRIVMANFPTAKKLELVDWSLSRD